MKGFVVSVTSGWETAIHRVGDEDELAALLGTDAVEFVRAGAAPEGFEGLRMAIDARGADKALPANFFGTCHAGEPLYGDLLLCGADDAFSREEAARLRDWALSLLPRQA